MRLFALLFSMLLITLSAHAEPNIELYSGEHTALFLLNQNSNKLEPYLIICDASPTVVQNTVDQNAWFSIINRAEIRLSKDPSGSFTAYLNEERTKEVKIQCISPAG